MNDLFDAVWQAVAKYQNQQFSTKTGLSFSYTLIGNVLRTNRTNRNLPRSSFETAWKLLPESHGPGRLANIVQGSAYVYAILTDPRIRDNA